MKIGTETHLSPCRFIVTSHSNYCMKFSDLHGLTYYQIRFLDDDTHS